MTEEKFDLMKLLKEKEKNEKLKFEGAILAFKLPNGKTGTTTFCNEIGIALRLMNESRVQEKMLEMENDSIASQRVFGFHSDQKEEKSRSTMFG